MQLDALELTDIPRKTKLCELRCEKIYELVEPRARSSDLCVHKTD